MGRTGRFFAHEHWGLRPDIITMSKALSGGYIPVGAVLCSDDVFLRVYSSMERALVHSTTFGRNQLAMVAGLATLAAFDDEDIVDRARRTGEAFEKGLAPLVERYEMFHTVRGKGLMIGLVFDKPTSRRLRMRWNALESMRTALFSQMIVVPLFHRHRILTQVAADNMNVIKLLPPLIAGQDEVDYFVDALDDVLADAHRGSGSARRVRRDDGEERAPAGRAQVDRRGRLVTTTDPPTLPARPTPPARPAITPSHRGPRTHHSSV